MLKLAELALAVVGLGCIVVGYRKNSRNLLVAGAVALWLSAAFRDFLAGLTDGLSGGPG